MSANMGISGKQLWALLGLSQRMLRSTFRHEVVMASEPLDCGNTKAKWSSNDDQVMATLPRHTWQPVAKPNPDAPP